MTGDALARELAERASESLEPIYVRLDRIAEEVLRARPPRAAFTEAHLSNLQRLLVVFIGEERAAWGMGFIAAPSVVEGRARYMAWWQRFGDRIARLQLNFDPASIDVYDFLQMDFVMKLELSTVACFSMVTDSADVLALLAQLLPE